MTAGSGRNGVYKRRHELPETLHAIGNHRLGDWVGTLLDREELVMAMAQGSKLVKWPDVPGGPVACGQALFVTGHLGRSVKGGRMGIERSRLPGSRPAQGRVGTANRALATAFPA